jgi:carbamoyltransferase
VSNILGISAGYHDAAAALIIDGHIVAAMQEERFSRMKNDAAIPRKAAQACLKQGGLSPLDLDQVVYYEDPFVRLERILLSLMRSFPRSWKQFPYAVMSQVGSKLWILDQLGGALQVPRSRITSTTHHRSHAASAFFPSRFDEAAVLTVDGVGEDMTTGIWHGNGRTLECLASIHYPHSLGLLYAGLTAYLGFEVNEGEYKVMGLAAFGTPRFKEEFDKLVKLHGDGSFELDLRYFAFHTDTDIGFSPELEVLLGPRRPPAKPWDLQRSEDDRRYADIAASLQWITEEAMLGLAREARRLTRSDNLCLAGGVALNCVANSRLLAESDFSAMFVEPAAGDAGGALGAAILGCLERDGIRPAALETAALGEPVSTDAAWDLAQYLELPVRDCDDVYAATAELIAADKIVAFARGRFEWGPRALGQRSILARPGAPNMRDRLNSVVKKREPFRPFAPAVLSDRADRWFSGCAPDLMRFMTATAKVRPERAAELGAVTHVDGTARVQTVTEKSAPELHRVLQAVDRLTGVPIVLNTSLNGKGEPIAASEVDALAFFKNHVVDALVVGDLVLERKR